MKKEMLNRLRPVGVIRITDPRGYGYIPKIVRREVGLSGRGIIPFFINANCILLVRRDANIEKILKGLDVLKRDLVLRHKEEKNVEGGRTLND